MRASFSVVLIPASVAAAWLAMSAPAGAGVQCGAASWYAMTTRTASGERADPNELAAAHRRLPFGTRVEVRNMRNDRTAVVRINDRGPFVRGRIIDVTRAAADRLGFRHAGHAPVRITVLDSDARPGGGC